MNLAFKQHVNNWWWGKSFDIIVDKVFIKYFEKDECSKKTFDRTSITIQCKRSIVKDLPPIGIVFGSTSITLQGDELFKDFFSDSISIIRKNESDKSSQWVLGVRFIRLFNILFDYKNKEHLAHAYDWDCYLKEDTTKKWTPTDVHAATTSVAFPDVDPTSDEFKKLRGKVGKRVNFA